MFREKSIKSRLMLAEPDENTRFKFTIWFDYTRQLVNDIQDGDLVAVPNFSSTPEQTRFSILEITNVMPSHYAMGTNKSDLRGYPGYLMESAGNLPTDWTEQEDKPTEDITKIVCEAIPINLEFHDIMGATMEDIPIEKEGAMPMVGLKVNLLSKNFTQRIMNLSIDIENDNNIQIGNLLRDEDVKIYTTVNDLIQTHIGIFGFTGVGKSNLVSTTISKILLNSKQNEKILLFDLMGEYTGLLIDSYFK